MRINMFDKPSRRPWQIPVTCFFFTLFYQINGEWEIISTLAQRNEFFYENSPEEKFSNVAFHM